MFNRFEQIDQYIVAVNDALDRLIRLGVTEMAVKNERKALTERRIASPVCIAATGGKFYRVRFRDIKTQSTSTNVPGQYPDQNLQRQ